jgi:2-aminoethylphosphonate-pyruvate transaminase
MIRTAVILAAGMGTRLAGIHSSGPKGFLSLGAKPIIEESIQRLVQAGIGDILIITGHQEEYYVELAQKLPFVRTIRNAVYASTGSMGSLCMAAGHVEGDFLLLESDLIYEAQALHLLLNQQQQDCILLSGPTGSGDEVWADVQNNLLKGLSKKREEIQHYGGELVGISRISHSLFQAMLVQADKAGAMNSQYHYEDCLTDLSRAGYAIPVLRSDDLAWMEIDDAQHHQRAVQTVYPLINQKDKQAVISKRVKREVLLNPGPATTSDSVKFAQVVPDICPREKEFGDLVESVRQDIVKVVHGQNTHQAVLFAASGTGAVEACLTSVVPGDKAVLIINNGAYGRRMQQICDGFGIAHVDYNIVYGDPVDHAVLRSMLEQHKGYISHIAFVHHETTVGILNDIAPISALAREYQAELIVDAMSSYAGIPINVAELGVHYLTSSSNKCIQGMAGISFVICDQAALEKTKNYKRRNFYFNLYDNWKFFAASHQMQFTPPVQVFYALRQALNEYFLETEQGRATRYDGMYQVLLAGLKKLGFQCLVDEQYHARLLTAIIEPEHPAYSFNAMHDYLYQRGFTIYPGKGAKQNTFRLSNIGQLENADILAALNVLEEYLQQAGITL